MKENGASISAPDAPETGAGIGCVDLMVDRHVRAGLGTKPALLEVSSARGGVPPARRALSYRSLQSHTAAIGGRLPKAHAQAKTQVRIAIIGSATLETICWWLAGMRAGHLVFLVHPDFPRAHYAALFQRYRPDLVFRDRTATVTLGEPLPELQADNDGVAGTRPGSRDAAEEVSSLDEGGVQAFSDRRPALVLTSSGSTGQPKLCVHAHRAFWLFERNVSRPMWRLSASDRVLASGGPYFSFGLQGVHASLGVGATAVLLPQRRAHTDFLDVMAQESVTVFLAVPTLYHLLQSRTSRERFVRSTASLRLCLSAGERLPEIVRQRWEAHSGGPMCDSIGTTETFAPYLSEAVGRGRGLHPIEGFDYEMRYADMAGSNGQRIFSAQVGGACMMLGYLGQHDSTPVAQPKFATDDLFVLEDRGWRFVSRRSERVKVSGYWVSPQELEEFLLTDPRVLAAGALPLETADGLLRLRAFVVLAPAAGPAEEVCRQLLQQAKTDLRPRALCPDRVCPVAELSSTSTGKLKRMEFQRQARGLHSELAELEDRR